MSDNKKNWLWLVVFQEIWRNFWILVCTYISLMIFKAYKKNSIHEINKQSIFTPKQFVKQTIIAEPKLKQSSLYNLQLYNLINFGLTRQYNLATVVQWTCIIIHLYEMNLRQKPPNVHSYFCIVLIHNYLINNADHARLLWWNSW